MHAFSSRFLRPVALCGLLMASAPLPAGAQASTPSVAFPAPAMAPSEPASSPVREVEWYRAEVPVSSQERREREAALGRALAQVLVRVTGRLDASAHPVVQRALRAPEGLVTDSDYRFVDEVAGGVPVQRQVLGVGFDPEAVDALVMAAGLPLWRGERAKPLLWLAIDDGSGAGPRLVSAQQINVVKPLADRGLERGLRLLLPGGTAIEQAAAGSIWALDASALAVLSSRYGASLQLLGKVSRAEAGGWQAEWQLSEGATTLQRWSVVDPSPQRALASGADRAAEVLAERQAVVLAAGEPEVIEAEILGLSGRGRYLDLAAALQAMPVLRSHEVLEAHPDRLRVRLDLAVDRARFEAMLEGSGPLAVERDADGVVRYRLRP